MNHHFWQEVAVHYWIISMAVLFNDTVFGAMSLLTFLTIPSLSNVELLPGIGQSFKAQIEVLKTMNYLNRRGYYEQSV